MKVFPILASAMVAALLVPCASYAQSNANRDADGWDDNDDYPERAWREGREGTTGFQLVYDWQGTITRCEITSSSGHADLDDAACRLVKRRGPFQPRAVGSEPLRYTNRIVWVIPKVAVPAFGELYSYPGEIDQAGPLKANKLYPEAARNEKREGTSAFRATYDWRGKVLTCEITSSSGHADLDDATCAVVRARGKFRKRPKGSPPVQFKNSVKWVINVEAR